MKRSIAFLTAVLFVIALASCAEKSEVRTNSGGKTVEDVINEKAAGETEKREEPVTEKATDPANDTLPAETYGYLPEAKNGDIDVDLTQLSATMVYAQVNDMLTYPDKYVGLKVRMRGPFAVYETDERNYYAVIITDATACCSTGIEFLLTDAPPYPSGYPEKGTEITVTGIYHTYEEGPVSYPELYDATME
ncbi:MAG: hypothetical protein IKN36_00450 [Clostridia bacterium]|nr:hypothetical protein [Clostridia bacterium]MBR6914804.1 hypothetical protein [Clostridia bacterium]